jgi:hypothetical protein
VRFWEKSLFFVFHFDDMYNWDVGKGVEIGGAFVKDVQLGRLHQVGLAREFPMSGACFKKVRWCPGQRFDSQGNLLASSEGAAISTGGGRR